MILVFNPDSGMVLQCIKAPDSHAQYYGDDVLIVEDENVTDMTHYVVGGVLVPFPEKPSPHHDWDWPTKSWLPNLDAAKATKKAEIETELSRRLYLPCNGFDADTVSRERISGTIARLQRGDGLPTGWVGWRDAENNMQWVTDDAATVLANLTALTRAIEDREQALLVAAWQHKSNIASLTAIEDLMNYNVEEGWNG